MARLTQEQRKILEEQSGLDELRQFISNSDYNDALIQYASANTAELIKSGPEDVGVRNPVREDMIQRSVAILSYLRDSGRDFTVTTDRYPGQLTAKIADSKMQIRVLDDDKNSNFVGRVYDNGVAYRLSTKNDREVSPVITPDMSVGLVKYALGESVNRINKTGQTPVEMDSRVGTADVAARRSVAPDTFITKDLSSFTTKYTTGNLHEETSPSGIKHMTSDSVYIYTTVEDKHTKSKAFYDAIRYKNGNDTEAGRLITKEEIERAETYIESARASAINKLTDTLKLDAVDVLAQSKARGEFDGDPEFSADSSFVVDMQKKYFNERYDIYSNKDGLYSDENAKTDALYNHDDRMHQEITAVFGSLQDRTINPINVAEYMHTVNGRINNENNLLTTLKYLRRNDRPYGIDGDGFAEDGFKDKLIDFDSKPVYDKDGNQLYPKCIKPASENFDKLSKFWQDIGSAVNDGLSETGVRVSDIQVDKNGIIHYMGDRHVGMSAKSDINNKVDGYLGQVFEPNTEPTRADGTLNPKFGLIETKFNSNNNYYIAAGYSAYVVPPTGDNADKTVEQRTRLRGYDQIMTDNIKSTLRHDIIANDKYDNTAGLNNVYHRIYGDKLPIDFEEQMKQEGKDDSMMLAITESARLRVRYDNCYKDGTTIIAKTTAEKLEGRASRGYNMYLDNVQTVMAVMNPETSKGYFDPYATGTGTNQGIVRYLVKDAKVNSDGSIQQGKEEHTALTAHPDFKYAEFNPPDRFIMSFMNAVNQSSTARGRTENLNGEKIEPIGVGTAHISLGGYTQDDAFVVSKEFAESSQIRGKDGNMRALQIGDKICDHSGNKGVLSFIADRNADMSYYEPKPLHAGMSKSEYDKTVKENDIKATQKKVIDVFKDNPCLDVIGAPYTAPSRFNGGTAREMIDSQKKAHDANMDTTLKINNKDINGGIGYPTWIITDMPVDEKTHVYDTEGGRKSSSQLVEALAEAGGDKIIDEIYKYNNEPIIKAREHLITMGYDISQTGELHKGYEPHVTGVDENNKAVYETRNEFSVRENFNNCRDEKGNLHRKNFKAAFDTSISEDGGFMNLPFPIKLASGEMTSEKLDENGKGTGEYRLPVLAGKYRSGRETVDNKLLMHEYTTTYKAIYDKAAKYLTAEQNYNTSASSEKPDMAVMSSSKDAMENIQASVQSTYNMLSDNIADRYFTGKHNIWKDDVMRKQLSHTTTAVITPDPTLDVDEIMIPATMAENFGLDKNDEDPRLLIWRDPVLSAGGIRYFRVKIIETRKDHPDYDANNPMSDITGICMNPSSAKSFEGDFDGDSMGGHALKSKAAKENAMQKFSYEAQMLNKECGERGNHDLYFTQELDVAAGVYKDEKNATSNGKKISELFNEAKQLANKADMNHDTRVDVDSDNHKALAVFNEAMHKAHDSCFGEDVGVYSNSRDHIQNAIKMTESGAKGSPAKIVNGYAPYFGVEVEIDDKNQITKFVDHEHSLASDVDRQASLSATHAKAVLTGIAGEIKHDAARMAKNALDTETDVFSHADAANALTHPTTQSVMQLKHDGPEEIRNKIDMIMNVSPALWAGDRIERVEGIGGKPTWEVVKEKNEKTGRNEPVKMSPDEFVKTFQEFYADKSGLAVAPPNSEYVKDMAKIMTVKDESGRMVVQGLDKFDREGVAHTEKPLDALAYGANLQRLNTLAERRANLFDGSVNKLIAPKAVRDNISEMAKSNDDPSYTPKLKPLLAKDTQQTGKLDTPSVDAADALLKNPKFENVEWERKGHLRHLKSGLVVEVKPTTVHRHEPTPDLPLDADGKKSAAYSIAMKMLTAKGTNDVSFTKDEQKFRVLLAEQSKELKSAGDADAQRAYLKLNPTACEDIRMYRQTYAICQTAHANGTKPYQAMNDTEKMDVVRSVVNKAYDGRQTKMQPTFTQPEEEYRSILRAQDKAYNSMDETTRNDFIAKNKNAFKDIDTYKTVFAECKAQREQPTMSKSVAKDSFEPTKNIPSKSQNMNNAISGGVFNDVNVSQDGRDSRDEKN